MTPWARRAVTASVLSLFGIVPHAVDDVRWGALERFGLSPDASASLFGLFAVLSAWAAVRASSGTRVGLKLLFLVGLVWTVAAAGDHWRAFFPGPFRDSVSARVWVWWIVATQGFAAFAAQRALRHLPEDGSERDRSSLLPGAALALTVLVPAGALLVDGLARCEEPAGRTGLVSSEDPQVARECPHRGGRFEGYVSDPDGNPIDMAMVQVSGSQVPAAAAFTGDDGRYAFGPLRAGTYTVTMVKHGYRSPEKRVRIDDGQITLVDFLLVPE